MTDVVLQEWFQLRLPTQSQPWGEPVYLLGGTRLLYCHDRTRARQAKGEIDRRYMSLDRSQAFCVFEGYGVDVPDGLTREREGLQFIARQAEHLSSPDEYVLVVQEL